MTDQLRKWLVFLIYRTRGQDIGSVYRRYQKEEREGIPPDTIRNNLIGMLEHCRQNVPYYQHIMEELGDAYREDPFEYLRNMPVLTKQTIHNHFEELKSLDLPQRKWYVNTTGGSTGEPVRFVQDREFNTLNGPITNFISWLAGADLGQSTSLFWGSLHDIRGAEEGFKAKAIAKITNNKFHSVYHLEPAMMDRYLDYLNRKRPKQIVAYASSLNEIAKHAEKTGKTVRPQNVIITSAGMLYPEFRETIERVFQCKVYDRYGSREVGSIAAERPGYSGMWVPPWGNYLEVVDENCRPVPDGCEGEILVTSFCNFAMPLIRYQIGDRGILAAPGGKDHPPVGQVLEKLSGRTVETYINAKNEVIDPSHFMPILYHMDWVGKYQVAQLSPSHIVFRIVKTSYPPKQEDLNRIVTESRGVMHDPTCAVEVEFVDHIAPTSSGKFKFIVSEINAPEWRGAEDALTE